MNEPPDDLDAARRAVAADGATAEASGHLTAEVAVRLPFESLGPFKNLLKRFFSDLPWGEAEDDALSDLVSTHVADGWWEHELGNGSRLGHGIRGGRYVLWVTGSSEAAGAGLFDRVFGGPVAPEPTPHPKKVKFNIGGPPAPGIWYRHGDEIDDPRVARLLDDREVADVMVAGDFVTVGLVRQASWERRLDDLLDLVTMLFWDPSRGESAEPARTRDELVAAGPAGPEPSRVEELHLLDPDRPEHRTALEAAAAGDDPRLRRVAVVTLAQSRQRGYVADALRAGYTDPSRLVRRAAVDAAVDTGREDLRPLLERALGDDDAWIRWKAVRGLRDLGIAASRSLVAALAEDDDFQVRFEVAAALRAVE